MLKQCISVPLWGIIPHRTNIKFIKAHITIFARLYFLLKIANAGDKETGRYVDLFKIATPILFKYIV